MINFPDNPTVNQVFTAGSQTWIYDGAKWVAYGVAQGIYLPLTGGKLTGALNPAGGIIGVTDGSDAAPGFVGEIISSAIATPGATLTTGVWSVITNIPLTAGDWDVQGEVWTTGSATGITLVSGAVSPNNGAPPVSGISSARNTIGGTLGGAQAIPTRTCRVSVSATTPYYLAGLVSFSGGTCAAYGNIWARRAR